MLSTKELSLSRSLQSNYESALAKKSPAGTRRSSTPPDFMSSPESNPNMDDGMFTIDMEDLMLPSAGDLEQELFGSSSSEPPESSATVVSSTSSEDFNHHHRVSSHPPPVSIRTTSSSSSSSRSRQRKATAAAALGRRHSLPESLLPGGDDDLSQQQPVPEFLCHLYSMLQDPSYSDLISWEVPDRNEPDHMGGGLRGIGKIVVHQPDVLQDSVLGRYYRHSKYASFQRQLNYFGFKKRLHNGKKGKLSPCSYIHQTLSDDVGSLFTLKRRPPAKKRGSEDDSDESPTSKTTATSSSSKRRRLFMEKKMKKNKNISVKKGKKKNQKHKSIDVSSSAIQVEATMSPHSPTSVATIYHTHNNSSNKNRKIRTASTVEERRAIASHKKYNGTLLSQPTLLEMLSRCLPPSDILFNDDVESTDDEGVPAWVTDDGKYHYHNVDSSLIDLAMLY